MSRWTLIVATLAVALLPLVGAEAADKRVGDPYPLATCPVSGEKLGAMGDPVVYLHEGREIRFCCKGCVKKFEKDPAKYLEKIDAEIIAKEKASYPLDTCPISGEKLGEGSMKPVDVVVGNRLVRLCCKGCRAKLEKNPVPTFRKLDKAIVEAQLPTYPLDTCVITGEKLGGMGKPYDHVYAGRLVRFCCKGCLGKFEKDPEAALAKIDAAMREKKDREAHADEGSR